MKLTIEDVEAARHVIAGASVVMCQNELTMAATRKTLEIAREAGGK